MLPDYLQSDYSNFKRTPNQFQRFHKSIHFCLLVLKNVVSVLYAASKASGYKNQKLEKYIYDNFMRPTEGVWLSFLELLLSTKYGDQFDPKKIIKRQIDSDLNSKLNHMYSEAIGGIEIISDKNSVYSIFQKVITIKNRYISHGLVSEDTAEKINDVFEPVIDELLQAIDSLINTELLMITEKTTDYGWKICNLKDGECKDDLFDTSFVYQEGLHYCINEKLIPANPLVTCRDGSILFYNKFDKITKKIFYNGANQKETYIRSDAEDCAALFGFDSDLLKARPLEIVVQVSEKQVYHNLPKKDYIAFIGRNSEINELGKAINHPRHFIAALDGIGGVGKSAIAIEFCYNMINKEIERGIKFEYVIWLSAKSTQFKDGKIQIINQAFEHLEQLIDTTLIVLGFPDYCNYEIMKKKQIVSELLTCTTVLFVLDNLETIQPGNLAEIWKFINDDIPNPSKVLLTSREYHQNVPQTIRVDNLTEEDGIALIEQVSVDLEIPLTTVNSVKKELFYLSSGLPIAIKSILGQMKLGKPFKSIKKEIETNVDNIAKFCFEQQLALLSIDQRTVLLAFSLASETLDHDAASYIVSDLITSPLLDSINQLISLSIVKINYDKDKTEYSLLPLIKTYVLNSLKDQERIEEVKKRLNEYYDLQDVESYNLLPIEERAIDRGSLIPRKIVDKAMQYAGGGEFEQADTLFKKATKEFSNESYVWFMYSQFKAQYVSSYEEAISCLKRANDICENYIYMKKIGDFHYKLRNYQTAVKSYKLAMTFSSIEKNKHEMQYSISTTQYEQVRQLRRAIKGKYNDENIVERNDLYKAIIEGLELYVSVSPHIYDGKLIKIFRILSECYFGLHKNEKALLYIDKAIDLSELDDTHVEFRHLILEKMR